MMKNDLQKRLFEFAVLGVEYFYRALEHSYEKRIIKY